MIDLILYTIVFLGDVVAVAAVLILLVVLTFIVVTEIQSLARDYFRPRKTDLFDRIEEYRRDFS